MAAVITQGQLELRVGVNTVATFCCDDGSQVANAAIVLEILEEAQDIGEGILVKGWPDQTARTTLIEQDRAVRGAVIDIAIGIMGRRRPELLSADGKSGSMYSAWRREAEALLERVADAERRTRAEKATGGPGQNAHVAQHANPSPAPLIFTTGRATGYRARGTF